MGVSNTDYTQLNIYQVLSEGYPIICVASFEFQARTRVDKIEFPNGYIYQQKSLCSAGCTQLGCGPCVRR